MCIYGIPNHKPRTKERVLWSASYSIIRFNAVWFKLPPKLLDCSKEYH